MKPSTMILTSSLVIISAIVLLFVCATLFVNQLSFFEASNSKRKILVTFEIGM